MATPRTRARFQALFGLLLLAALGTLLAAPAAADLKEDLEKNFALDIPEGWSWDPFVPEWTKYDIVVSATRRLDKLKNGKASNGEGAQVQLALSAAPEGRDLDALLQDKDVRGFLLARFEGASPEVETVSDEIAEGVPMRILRADGKARNLEGKLSRARGVMLLTVVKKKLYKLRMYAWHTEFDDEGLRSELDLVEVNFYIPDTKEEAPTDGSVKPPPGQGSDEEVLDGDAGEVKVVEDKALGIKITKPKKIKTKEDYDRDTYPDVAAWFEDSDRVGSYQVILTVFPKGRVVDGRAAPDVDLRDWIGTKWWPEFNANHPEGPLLTYKWPRKTETGSFITLPLFDEPITVVEKPERRPIEADTNDMDKMKIVEKVKGRIKMGSEKPNEAWRGVMAGNRPRVGNEIVLRFAWGTARHSYEMTVSIARDALLKWEAPLRELLENIELLDR